jgi:hypothetical protein
MSFEELQMLEVRKGVVNQTWLGIEKGIMACKPKMFSSK